MEPEHSTACWPGQAGARDWITKLSIYTWARGPECEWAAGVRSPDPAPLHVFVVS